MTQEEKQVLLDKLLEEVDIPKLTQTELFYLGCLIRSDMKPFEGK